MKAFLGFYFTSGGALLIFCCVTPFNVRSSDEHRYSAEECDATNDAIKCLKMATNSTHET